MKKGIVKLLLRFFVFGFSFLITTIATAVTPLPMRFSADGYASTDYTVGQADLMLPLKGDARHNFYFDPALAIGSDSQGYGDLGLGYRWLKNNIVILGGYFFGGYSRIDNNARLWVVNPGIEALSSHWDAHLNGYLVMGERNTNISSFLTFKEFVGHSEFFNVFNITQHAGNGVDAKFGYLIPNTPLKAYVGSYFFSPAQTNNVLGGAAGVEYWVNQHTKVFASYTYDSLRRSVGALGIGVELGGTHIHRTNPSVEERMTDPVERYLAELGRGSAIPSQQKTQFAGIVDPIIPGGNGNFVFFSLTGGPNNGGMGLTLNDCTFENPCGPTDLTNQGAQTLANLFPNTRIFFLGGAGTYSALNVLGGTNPVTLQTGQSINAFTPSQPPTFNGGFILPGNNSLNNIILLPTASTGTGAGVSALGNNVTINDSQIGSMANPFATGLALSGDTVADLISSRISASSTGIDIEDTAALNSNASTVSVNGGDGLIGINSNSTGPINLTEGTVVNVTGANSLFGIQPNGNFLLDNSQVNVTGGDSITGVETKGQSATTVSDGGSINVNATGLSARGFFDSAAGDVNFRNGSINVNSSGGGAYGYYGFTDHPVNFSEGSSINVTNTAPGSIGYYYQNSGPVTFSEGSAINVMAPGQNMTIGFRDAFGSGTGDILFDASSINVTGGMNTTGFMSEGTGNLNIVNNSVVNVSGSDGSFGLNVLDDRNVNFLDSRLNFTGGNTSVGLNSLGNGNTVIRNGQFDFTEGDLSSGFIFGGNRIVSIEESTHNFTGGENFVGVITQDGASVGVTESIFDVTAGDNAYVYEIDGSGPITLGEGSSLHMNAPGRTSVGGIHLSPLSTSELTLDEAEVIVLGGNTARGIFAEGLGNTRITGTNFDVDSVDAIGVDVLGTGVIDLAEANLIDVGGTGNLYGIRAINGLSITGGDLNLIVAAEDAVSTAIGLAALNTGIINLNDIGMDISGGPGSLTTQSLGGIINLTGTNVCLLNGSAVVC